MSSIAVRVDGEERLPLPQEIREELKLAPGDTVFVRMEGGFPRVAKGEEPLDELERDPAIRIIRERLAASLERDPEAAALFRRPLVTEEPDHEILDRCRAGEFRD